MELEGKGIDVQLEESQEYEHQANGVIESTVRAVQEQCRTVRLAVEEGYKTRLKESDPIWAWLVRAAPNIIKRYQDGVDGKTAWFRLKGKPFKRSA